MDREWIDMVTKRVIELMQADLIPVEASARHIHLSKAHAIELFGCEDLTIKKALSQPGQFQYEERVKLISTKGIINGVAILGPCRDKTQVEISKTDAFSLGINPPIRDSGDLFGSESLFIVGEKGVVKLNQGVIIAKRHIHMTKEDGRRFHVADGDLVNVKLFSQRPVIFEEVLIRIKDSYRLAMHIDIDEANASGQESSTLCKIIQQS